MPDPKTVSLEGMWLVVLRDLGLDPADVLRRAELPEDLFQQERQRVSVPEYFRFWEALDALADDPLLPITLTERAAPESFMPPLFAALCSSCLGVAVRRLADHKRLIAPMVMDVEQEPAGLFVGYRWEDETIRSPVSLAAVELIFSTQIGRIGTREHLRPVRAETPYAIEPLGAYREFLGCEVETSERHGVTFAMEDVERPFLTANESMWEMFAPELRRRMAVVGAAAPITERVHSVLLETLPSGEATVQVVARRLGMSARSLQRALNGAGTSYKDLVQSTRERLARHYVTATSISYTEIGFLLGFAEPSSFFRAFRDWTGSTPDSLRSSARAAGPPSPAPGAAAG